MWKKHQERLRRAADRNTGRARLICVGSALAALLFFSLYSFSLVSTHQSLGARIVKSEADVCDYSQGNWIYDPSRKAPYNESCSDIFKGWNCIKNNMYNAGSYLKWRWQPQSCVLPRLDPQSLLERLRNKSIGFVGDSLNRNMYASLVCSLKTFSKYVNKWRPAGSDKAVTFTSYNLTIAYHRTNLLARYSEWKASERDAAPKQGYRVDVDIPQNTWAQAPYFHDILIINTGHWWAAPEKFNETTSPLLFFQNGMPIIPSISTEDGLRLVLHHMLNYIERSMSGRGVRIVRTQSPRHFEGGDWKEGGKCNRTEPLSREEVEKMYGQGMVNSEVDMINRHLMNELMMRRKDFHVLDISGMSKFRADAHPSLSAKKQHEDCMHWCLPGVTDSWNDILASLILALYI